MTDQTPPFKDHFDILSANVERFIHGKTEVVQLALTCLFAGGHILVEDVPGVGKTSLAKAIATSLGGSFQRVQFTADLLPSDITGVQVFDPAGRNFNFVQGPVFANVVLADEINRASAKTQSALLQVMAERKVTVGRTTHPVPEPFLCIATENPVEYLGTYMLPEAQLDRFMMRLSMGYPEPAHERRVIADGIAGMTSENTEPVISTTLLLQLIKVVRQVYVNDPLKDYIVALGAATRNMPDVLRLGASPRACINLAVAAQARAASVGRTYATADDVKALAPFVFAHRLLLHPHAKAGGHTAEKVLTAILADVPVPKTS